MTRQQGGAGFIAGLALCCMVVTAAAAAQTAPNPAGAPATRQTSSPTVPGCLKNNPFGAASADSIKQKILAKGFTNVRGLYQGCDGIWRGHALQNGIDASIMVTPTGQVLKAGY